MSENLLSKISVATVYGKIKTVVKTVDGEPVKVLEAPINLMRVIGQATGYDVRTSQYGESLRFDGVFKAVNHETGEVFRAGSCFFPKVFESQLGAVLDSVESGAEFALDIAAVPANNAYGYEYRVKPLLEVAEAPIISSIEQRIGGLLPAPKPEKAEKIEKSKK